MPIQGLKYNILSNSEQHTSFQSTGSFAVYNPNDGIAFVATDRTATSLDWDYKVPSQSGGHLPGPVNSYLSIYYLDQSGTGAPGAVVVYASPETVNIPRFWSIGRALQSVGSSLDIQQGSQPGNPGTGITRVWSDGTGNLHILLPTGQDKVVIDSGNIGSQSLGGDLYGTVNNGHVGIQNGSAIMAYDGSGTLRTYLSVGTEEAIWDVTNGGFRWLDQQNTVERMRLTASNDLYVTRDIHVGSYLYFTDLNHIIFPNGNDLQYTASTTGGRHIFTAGGAYAQVIGGTQIAIGDVIVDNGSTNNGTVSSCLRFGNASNEVIASKRTAGGNQFGLDFYTGSVARMSISSAGVVTTQADLYSGQNLGAYGGRIYMEANHNTQWYFNWPYMDLLQGNVTCRALGFSIYGQSCGIAVGRSGSELQVTSGLYVTGNQQASGVGSWCVVGGNNNNGQSFYCAGGAGGPTSWQVISTKKYKKNIVQIDSALKIVMSDVHGYHFDLEPPDHVKLKANPEDPDEQATFTQYGYIGEEWETVAPDVLDMAEGQVRMMDYNQVGAILFEAFKEYVVKTDARLAALEKVA